MRRFLVFSLVLLGLLQLQWIPAPAQALPTATFVTDVSEYQGAVDWAGFGAERHAVIVRAHSGWRPDKRFVTNQEGARAHAAVRGYYQYLVQNRDPVAQADDFVATVGPLQAYEFAVLDIEEGAGDQTARAQAWLTEVDAKLSTRAWIYTGRYFAQDHLQNLNPFFSHQRWIAAYQSSPPAIGFDLWQYTDAANVPGVYGATDDSVFFGTLQQLQQLVTAGPATTGAVRFPNATGAATAANGGTWVVGADGGVGAYRGAAFYGSLPGLGIHPVAPIVAIVSTADGDGYWEIGKDGGVFAFGAAVPVTPYAPLQIEFHDGLHSVVSAALKGHALVELADDGSQYAFAV